MSESEPTLADSQISGDAPDAAPVVEDGVDKTSIAGAEVTAESAPDPAPAEAPASPKDAPSEVQAQPDQPALVLKVTHGTYHGDGCPDPSTRLYPGDIGFPYDAHHPARVGELLVDLEPAYADSLVKTGCFKKV